MVTLSTVSASNTLVSSTFPLGLVAVFVGATSGIGEVTLKKFAQYSIKPRTYFIGRSQVAADRIVAECKLLNSDGEFIFVKADVSLIRVVDEVCEEIKRKEASINLLFLSPGVGIASRGETSENLPLLSILNYYARMRFITNLLPQLKSSSSLRRIVSVGGGGEEGPLNTNDFAAIQVPLHNLKGHLSTLVTLGLESVAKMAPEVSFIHDYPGTVRTKLLIGVPEEVLKGATFVPVDECGERHIYLATSAAFSPLRGASTGVALGEGLEVIQGTTGKAGSGLYSVGRECESASAEVLELLAGYRAEGLVESVWNHTEGEFKRILGG